MCVVLNIDEVTFSFLDFSSAALSAVEEAWPAAESEIDVKGGPFAKYKNKGILQVLVDPWTNIPNVKIKK